MNYYIYFLSSIISIFGIWRTGTRGVLLGLLGGIFVSAIIVAIFEKKGSVMKKTAIGGIALILLLVVGFLSVKNTQIIKSSPMLERLSTISWSNVTGQGQARQYVWPMAIKGFQEHPVLGWGQDGFNNVFNKYGKYQPGF